MHFQKGARFIKQWKPTPEEAWDIFQLRDVVLPKFTVFGEQWQVLQVLPAGVGWVQLVELPVHDSPSLHFLLCELDARDRIPTATRDNSSLSIKKQLARFQEQPSRYRRKLTVWRPWQDQQSTFAFSGRRCPWNPDKEKHRRIWEWFNSRDLASFFFLSLEADFVPSYRMIRIQLRAVHQDTVSTFVQVWNLLWEPRNVIHIWEERSKNWFLNYCWYLLYL